MSLFKKVICTLVLAFFYFNYSLGLFQILVQVLVHIELVHLSINCPFSLLGQRVCTVR
jgi:hypothetical protein